VRQRTSAVGPGACRPIAAQRCSCHHAAPTTTVAGPVTVEQLVERSSDTPIAVEGFLHASDGVVRLCAAILESYLPQCGEPSVELVGVDMEALDGVTTAEGVSWKEGVVLAVQRRQDARCDVLAG
jgi:hypothetical protein